MRFIIAVLLLVSAPLSTSNAAMLDRAEVGVASLCPPHHQTVTVTGQQVSAMIGLPVQRLAVYRWSGDRLRPVIFQIDRKDEHDRYILDTQNPARGSSRDILFDANDELVFMWADAGPRMPQSTAANARYQLLEIRLRDTHGNSDSWVYLRVFDSPIHSSGKQYIHYFPDTDIVQTDLYRIGFSTRSPFLIDLFNWHDATTDGWSPDILDTMKIRHYGKLLGMFTFYRTQDDYTSNLVAVKRGPVRVIRRTENRVRVFWDVKTPALYIDYVMAPAGFVMDTIVDIPFTMGMFFSDVETLTTVDWNDARDLPVMTVHAEQLASSLALDGTMSDAKRLFNRVDGDRFGLSSQLGSMQVKLDIPDAFPVDAWLYLRDAIDEPDPPETIQGQYGNIGFRTTGWERIDTEVHHLQFSVCLDQPGD